MARWLMVLLAAVGLLLAGIVAVGLAGAVLWLVAAPSPSTGAVHIAPVAPLVTPSLMPAAVVASPPVMAVASPLPAPVVAPVQPVAATAAAPITLTPPPDATAMRLLIPRLNLDAPVIVAPVAGQSWQVSHLRQAVGHLAGTAAPGVTGNMVLAGHVTLADGSAGPFARLDQLALADEVWVVQGAQRFKYIVDSYQMVDPAAVSVTYPADTGRLTLITCSNWNAVAGRYLSRLVVTGRLVTG